MSRVGDLVTYQSVLRLSRILICIVESRRGLGRCLALDYISALDLLPSLRTGSILGKSLWGVYRLGCLLRMRVDALQPPVSGLVY